MLTAIKSLAKYKYLKYGYAILVVPVFFILRYYYNNNPEVAPETGFFPQCPFHVVTGLHCPGCGSQRAVHDLLHFRVGEALSHNIVVVLLAIIIFSIIYSFITKRYFKPYHYELNRQPYFTITVAVLVFVYWILRNIPIYPFTELAP